MKFLSAERDRLKVIEAILSGSLANFAVTKALRACTIRTNHFRWTIPFQCNATPSRQEICCWCDRDRLEFVEVDCARRKNPDNGQ